MVTRLVHNPILKGERRRNQRLSKRWNKTGRRKSVPAPPGERLSRTVPHLAFITAERYDRLIAKLVARNGMYARGQGQQRPDGRVGVPKKRTMWPGQHLRCGVCGRLMYWGGHGRAETMMCAGVRDYQCWNVTTVDGRFAAQAIVRAALTRMESLPEFDAAFREAVEATVREQSSTHEQTRRRFELERLRLDREIQNVTQAIASMGFSAALHADLVDRERRQIEVGRELEDQKHRREPPLVLPPIADLRALVRQRLETADFCDPPVGRFLRELMPTIELFPYRLIDGEDIVLRAHVMLTLVSLVGPGFADAGAVFTHRFVVDLFEPPQREAFRTQIVALRAAGLTERSIAERLGLTVTATQRAMALHRRMQAEGRSDAYVCVTEAPRDSRRNSRLHHPRYRFSPLLGYPAPSP